MLRCTAVVQAPARTVVAAAGQLIDGVELPGSVPARPAVLAPLTVRRVDERGILAASAHRQPRELAVSVRQTAGGTLLTCTAGWGPSSGGAARVWQVLVGRRRVLKMLDVLINAVRERAERLATAPVVVGVAIVGPDGVLAGQRDRPPEHAGRWEFPGGRVEADEDERDAVLRECREELGVDVRVGERIGPDVVLPTGWLLRVYDAELVAGQQPRALDHRAIRWVAADELTSVDWLDADRALLPAVRSRLVPAGEPGGPTR